MPATISVSLWPEPNVVRVVLRVATEGIAIERSGVELGVGSVSGVEGEVDRRVILSAVRGAQEEGGRDQGP
jgi:hypothetical protein